MVCDPRAFEDAGGLGGGMNEPSISAWRSSCYHGDQNSKP